MTDQPIAHSELSDPSTLSPRLQEVEAQLHQLMEVLPRLVKDVKTYARVAQHMEQCAAEVNQWYGEIKSLSTQGPQEGVSGSATAAEPQLQQLNEQIEQVRNDFQNALAEQILQVKHDAQVAVTDHFAQVRSELQHSQGGGVSSGLEEEVNTLKQEWQTVAGMLQQMQVQMESLQAQAGNSQNLPDQLERLRGEMTALITKTKTEQEAQLQEQKKRLADLSEKAGGSSLSLWVALGAGVLGIIGIVR